MWILRRHMLTYLLFITGAAGGGGGVLGVGGVYMVPVVGFVSTVRLSLRTFISPACPVMKDNLGVGRLGRAVSAGAVHRVASLERGLEVAVEGGVANRWCGRERRLAGGVGPAPGDEHRRYPTAIRPA